MKIITVTLITKANENIRAELNIEKMFFMKPLYYCFIGENGGYKSTLKVHSSHQGTMIYFSDRFKVAIQEDINTLMFHSRQEGYHA